MPATITTPQTNEAWIASLQATGAVRDEAIQALRTYLLRAVLVYLTRHRSDLSVFHYDELRQLAEDWTQEAVLQVLNNLDSFRGDSKFTTWSYRVAINLVAGELRRKRWETTSLDALELSRSAEIQQRLDDRNETPEAGLTRGQIWEAVESVLLNELTDRQRTVLTRVVLDGEPVEIVATDMGTNRNNIYKIVHDARKKMKQAIETRGWTAEEVLDAFRETNGA